MPWFILIFALEAVICNLIFQPTINTNAEVASIFLLGINSLIIIFLLLHTKKFDEEKLYIDKILILGFVLRILLLLWDIYARDIFILPNSEADAVWYHKVAISFAFGQRADTVDLTDYSYYVGLLYRFIGVQKITVEFLHVYLSMFSVTLIYSILCNFNVSSDIKKKAMLFACFLPNLMLVTTVFLQESVIAFLLILSLYLYSIWWTKEKSLFFLLAILCSAAASFLHMGGIVAAIGYVVTYMFVGNKDRVLRLTFGKAVLGFILIFGMIILISANGESLLDKIGGELSAESIVSSAGKTDRVSDADYSIGIQGLPPTLDIIVNSPLRMIYFVASPMPWMWRGIADLIAFFGSAIFYVYTIIMIFKTISKCRKKEKPKSIFAFFFVIVVIYFISALMFGWGVSNTGTALRHREKFTYICIVITAISQECMLRLEEDNEESISNSSRLQRRTIS